MNCEKQLKEGNIRKPSFRLETGFVVKCCQIEVHYINWKKY